VIKDTSEGDEGDRIVGGVIGIIVLIALTLLAAQFLLALTMAWFLGYGGIFLLGFGGARWSSQIAINYYKHVVAVGVAILALSVVGLVSEAILGNITPSASMRSELPYARLGEILVVSILLLVLGLRVPQLLYTLVTGSSLGMFAGTAGMVGSAIAAGGGAAFASVSGGLGARNRASGSGESTHRSSSAMEAVERSAVSASGMADPFHVAGGSDPFGVPRRPDSHRGGGGGSVFGTSASHSTVEANASSVVAGTARQSAPAPAPAPGTDDSTGGQAAGGSGPGKAGDSIASPTSGSFATAPDPMSRDRAHASASHASAIEPGETSQTDYTAEMSAIVAERGDVSVRASELGATAPSQDLPASGPVHASLPLATEEASKEQRWVDAGGGDDVATAVPLSSTAQVASPDVGLVARAPDDEGDRRGESAGRDASAVAEISLHEERDLVSVHANELNVDVESTVTASDQERVAMIGRTNASGSATVDMGSIADESAPTETTVVPAPPAEPTA